MDIRKRDGRTEEYDRRKITAAIAAAFLSTGSKETDETFERLTSIVEKKIGLPQQKGPVSVEAIQDMVEQALMETNFFPEAKSFILYREKRTRKRVSREKITKYFENPALTSLLRQAEKDFPEEEYDFEQLAAKFSSFQKEDMTKEDSLSFLIKAAVELTKQEAPKWEFIAARLLMFQFYERLSVELFKRHIHGFYEKLCYLEEEGLYGSYIRNGYSQNEIEEAETFLVPERDKLFTYSSLELLLQRYVIHNRQHVALETPQEMFLGIALHLALKESKDRLSWVKKFYDMLSTLQVTMATPTMSNARKPYHQLSSCFIDTVPDSLTGIYRSISNFAQVSKFGGGMGLYFGKVRAAGSPIRGFEGAAGGIVRWIKLANDTAVAVDQLGVRQGSVAVYLDAWHKDLPEFLQLRTNNGDDRMKAHDVFPAVCYPDLFWKIARDNIDADWYLMCPHEVQSIKGYRLEDCYGEEWEKKYQDCVADARICKRIIPIKDLLRLIIKSAVETGTPFVFNRDHVNAMNPNSHKGVIYCSNLCTEIAQNMGSICDVNQEIKTVDGETVVVETTKPGDFVVCNLASLSLGNIDVNDREHLANIVRCAVRALDNVIDLNFYPVPYAGITNQNYRSIGLGVSGYHHMLAKNKIQWESEEHLAFVDSLFEDINFAAVSTSCEIAKEKGSYRFFEGSDWPVSYTHLDVYKRQAFSAYRNIRCG